jgi:hypothetical protein
VTVTNLANTDVYIYKDASLTQRTSFSGIAVDIDVDAIVGNHWVTIDLSDNTDAGFYVAGSRYQVRMEGVTIDGATINAWIGAFSIGCTLRPTTAGRKLTVESDGMGHADLKEWLGVAPLALVSQRVSVDATAISGDSTAADNLESACDNYSATRGLSGTALPAVASGSTGGLATQDGFGAVKANLWEVFDSLLSQGAGGQLAGGFINFFDVNTPTGTVNSLPAAIPDAAGGLPVSDAGGLDLDLYLKSGVTLTGTANALDTTTQITLTGGVATDNYYNGQLVIITGGTGVGQSRQILSYIGSTAVATPTRDWAVAPAGDSTFVVIGADVSAILEGGVATAGAAGSITFDATASTTVNLYKNNFVMITGGTGRGQTRLISAYSAGRVASVTPNWTTTPDTTSIYQVVPTGRVDIAGWSGNLVTGDGDWAALKAETALIVADTNELQTDWVDGGRLDLILDAILVAAGDEATPAGIWTYATRTLTQSAATTYTQVSGSTITLARGDTLSAAVTGLGSIANRSKLWFTVKGKKGDAADTAAFIQIEVTDGLLYINEAAAGTSANGSITVDDEDAGDITLTLKPVESAKLPVNSSYVYDIQVLTTAGVVTTLTSGVFKVTEDVTRATS